MEAFLRSGSRDGAEDFISGDCLENFTAVDAYEEEVIGDESHDGLRGGMVAALVSAFPDIDVAEVHEAVDQVLKDACVGIEAADKSVQIGRESWRERGWQLVMNPGGSSTLTNKNIE